MEGAVAAQTEATQEGFSGTEFRQALGTFATGVTVITTQSEEHAFGMTANAFSSLSLDPPLVLVCVISGTTGCEMIQANRVFAINILGAHQEQYSRYFASKERPRGRDAFREIPHRAAATGSPIIEGVAGYLDCRLEAEHEAGDHFIFVGEVLSLGVDPEVKPLIFHSGAYRYIREDEG